MSPKLKKLANTGLKLMTYEQKRITLARAGLIGDAMKTFEAEAFSKFLPGHTVMRFSLYKSDNEARTTRPKFPKT